MLFRLPSLFALLCTLAAADQRYIALVTPTSSAFSLSADGTANSSPPLPAHAVTLALLIDLEALPFAWGSVSGSSSALSGLLDGTMSPSRQLQAEASAELPLLFLDLTPAGAAYLRSHASVQHLEEDVTVGPGLLPALAAQSPALVSLAGNASTLSAKSTTSLGLDRIDQRSPPLDGEYRWLGSGTGITVLLLDSGLRSTHSEFAGRVFPGANFAPDQGREDTSDTAGHGTCVGSLAVGSRWGVAKGARIVPVRVYGASNSGPLSQVLLGVNFILQYIQANCGSRGGGGRCVINMSFGGAASDIMDAAVQRIQAEGGTVVAAAGNEAGDACGESPARAAGVLCVGASTTLDAMAPFSNYGSCVSLFAPGVAVPCASPASDTAIQAMSGTSMSTPFVTGTAALYLQSNPSSSVAQVRQGVLCAATVGGVKGVPDGTTSLLVYTEPSTGFPSPEEVAQCGISGAAGSAQGGWGLLGTALTAMAAAAVLGQW